MPAVIGITAAALAIFAGAAWWVIRDMRKEKIDDRSGGVIARFDDIALTRSSLVVDHGRGSGTHRLAGVRAEVETAGQIRTRYTATRMATVGMFALAIPKKYDDRTVFLTIQGPGVAVLREVRVRANPGTEHKAREFAATLNAQAMAAEQGPAAAPR